MDAKGMALVGALFLMGCSPEGAPPTIDDSAVLGDIGKSFERFQEERWLYLQVKNGVRVEKIPLLPSVVRSSEEEARRLLARLDELRLDRLSHEEAISVGVLRWELRMAVEDSEHYLLLFSMTPRQLRAAAIRDLFEDFEFTGADEADRYLRLVDQLPDWIAAFQKKAEEQAERGIRLPVAGIDVSVPVWKSFERFLLVDPRRLEALSDEEAEAFQKGLKQRLEENVFPAVRRFVDYLQGEYRDLAPSAIGLAQYPGGKECYRHLLRYFTTLDMDPEEIHRIGLRRVGEINEKMAKLRQSLGFEGSREEFHRSLDRNPRFFAKTPEEIESVLWSYVRKMEPHVKDYFLKSPRTPYDIRRLPPSLEGSMAFGYYDWPTAEDPVGTYYYNGSKLSERSLLVAESLIYHELIPGHHFQVSLQDENESIPDYRRESIFVGFSEGWAHYAAGLGVEMGLYEDPYSLYGRYAVEMRMAVRLVVDTGLNYLGWTLEEASAYMRENTLDSEAQIASEMPRYGIDVPGSAPSYELGSLKFMELRHRAEEALGERFDLRKLHNALLENGAVPLAVLDGHIDDFIEQSRQE